MDMTVFPSILPLSRELSDKTDDVELSMNDFNNLMQAARDSKAALRAGVSVDIASTTFLGESILSFELALEKLRIQYHRLRALEHEKVNIALPTARLPVEIIRCIFQFDADEHRAIPGKRLLVDKTWLRLGNVCRLWRRIIFAMSELWANDMFAFGDDRWKQILPLTKGAPLNLDLSRSVTLEQVDGPNTTSLVPRAWRICASKVSRGHGDFRAIVDMLCSKSLPHLQTLALNHCDTRVNGEPPMKSHMSEHPHLRFVTLNNIYLVPPSQSRLYAFKLDLLGLMDGEIPCMDAVLHVLLGNTHLRRLELRNYCATVLPEPGPLPQRTIFPSLTSLRYAHTGDVQSTTLFDHLRLPQLHDAVIRVQELQGAESALVVLRRILGLWWDPNLSEDEVDVFSWQSIAITLLWNDWGQMRALNRELQLLSRSSGVQLTAKSSNSWPDRSTKFIVERRK